METMPVYIATLSGDYAGGLAVIAAVSEPVARAELISRAKSDYVCRVVYDCGTDDNGQFWETWSLGAEWSVSISELLAPAGPPRVLYLGAYAE
jgi:hypothetical protein